MVYRRRTSQQAQIAASNSASVTKKRGSACSPTQTACCTRNAGSVGIAYSARLHFSDCLADEGLAGRGVIPAFDQAESFVGIATPTQQIDRVWHVVADPRRHRRTRLNGPHRPRETWQRHHVR